MHLFLFDLYISIDNLCPIINQLDPKKTIICNINAIQNYKNNKLVSLTLKKNIKYYNYLPLSNQKIILYYALKAILILPCSILKKMRFLWLFIYKKFFFSSENKIQKFLISNKIKSISYEESAPKIIVEKFFNVAKKNNIKVIKIASGLRTAKLNKMGKEKLSHCHYYIAPNKVRGEKKNQNFKDQIKYFGSLRFSEKWIKKLKIIYGIKSREKTKINIGVFKKFFSSERLQVEQLIDRLKFKSNYLIKTREKPRDVSPLNCAKFNQDDISSTQLIECSDVLITSRSSSMLIEAAIYNKKIILLEYLNKNISTSAIYNFKFILKAKKFDDLEYLINKENKVNRKELIRFINKFLINFYHYKKIKNDYINFYRNFL